MQYSSGSQAINRDPTLDIFTSSTSTDPPDHPNLHDPTPTDSYDASGPVLPSTAFKSPWASTRTYPPKSIKLIKPPVADVDGYDAHFNIADLEGMILDLVDLNEVVGKRKDGVPSTDHPYTTRDNGDGLKTPVKPPSTTSWQRPDEGMPMHPIPPSSTDDSPPQNKTIHVPIPSEPEALTSVSIPSGTSSSATRNRLPTIVSHPVRLSTIHLPPSPISPTNSVSIHLESYISSGFASNGYFAKLSQPPTFAQQQTRSTRAVPVFVKLTSAPSAVSGPQIDPAHEARVYERLKPIQGTVIPHFLGLFKGMRPSTSDISVGEGGARRESGDPIWATVMEDAGWGLDKSFTSWRGLTSLDR